MKGNMGSKQASTSVAGRKFVTKGTTVKLPLKKGIAGKGGR